VGIEALPTFYSHWYTSARSVQQVTLLGQHESLQGGGGVGLSTVLLSNLLGNHLHGHAQHPSFSLSHYEIESQKYIAFTAMILHDAIEIFFAGYHRCPLATFGTSGYKVMSVNAIVAKHLHRSSTSGVS
jgi:hypothetical protein